MRLRRTMMFVPGNNPGMMADAHIYGSVFIKPKPRKMVTEKRMAMAGKCRM